MQLIHVNCQGPKASSPTTRRRLVRVAANEAGMVAWNGSGLARSHRVSVCVCVRVCCERRPMSTPPTEPSFPAHDAYPPVPRRHSPQHVLKADARQCHPRLPHLLRQGPPRPPLERLCPWLLRGPCNGRFARHLAVEQSDSHGVRGREQHDRPNLHSVFGSSPHTNVWHVLLWARERERWVRGIRYVYSL